MPIFKKEKHPNGKRIIYFFGKKVLSYSNRKKSHKTSRSAIGPLFPPYYNRSILPSNVEPEIYNRYGKKMRTFFLRDFHLAADPTGQSQYFIWDKFNIGLDVHFYSHQAMLETMGNPKHKFGLLIETEAIVPQDYQIFKQHPDLAKQFDLIFTNSKQILDTVSNARFAPVNCSLYGGSFIAPDGYKHKTKNTSILSSAKQMCPLHKYRYDLAHQCKQENLCDTFGTFDGGNFINIDETLRNYRFSICIENIQTPYLFTERLITAFANQCIPIYLGATEIDKFFNPDGIITITPETNIRNILKQCTPEEYTKRLPAILDNYERAKKYINPWDYIFENHLKEII